MSGPTSKVAIRQNHIGTRRNLRELFLVDVHAKPHVLAFRQHSLYALEICNIDTSDVNDLGTGLCIGKAYLNGIRRGTSNIDVGTSAAVRSSILTVPGTSSRFIEWPIRLRRQILI